MLNRHANIIESPVRWMQDRHTTRVLEIYNDCHEESLTDRTLRELLRDAEQTNIGIVFETDSGDVAGFAIYSLLNWRIQILRIAVAGEYRRLGVGTALIERIKGRLRVTGRDTMSIVVDERAMAAQHFLSACGFIAEQIGDEIRFTYRMQLDD